MEEKTFRTLVKSRDIRGSLIEKGLIKPAFATRGQVTPFRNIEGLPVMRMEHSQRGV